MLPLANQFLTICHCWNAPSFVCKRQSAQAKPPKPRPGSWQEHKTPVGSAARVLCNVSENTVELGFPIWVLARDQRGLFFRILTPLCIVASIFHRLSVSMLCFSCSEALRAPFWTTNTPFRPNAKTAPLRHRCSSAFLTRSVFILTSRLPISAAQFVPE